MKVLHTTFNINVNGLINHAPYKDTKSISKELIDLNSLFFFPSLWDKRETFQSICCPQKKDQVE